jgi:hypothetical protein
VNAVFETGLAKGQLGEKLVASWLQGRGWGIVPLYDYSGRYGDRAPSLQFKANGHVLPDLDACRDGRRVWCEVKTYRSAAFNRSMEALVHGIPRRLFDAYSLVGAQSGSPVFIFVLEVESGELLVAKQSEIKLIPCQCGGCKLGGRCYVRDEKGGIHAGVYWRREDMTPAHQFTDDDMREIRAAWKAAA